MFLRVHKGILSKCEKILCDLVEFELGLGLGLGLELELGLEEQEVLN